MSTSSEPSDKRRPEHSASEINTMEKSNNGAVAGATATLKMLTAAAGSKATDEDDFVAISDTCNYIANVMKNFNEKVDTLHPDARLYHTAEREVKESDIEGRCQYSDYGGHA
jgi:hypothetical protein